MIVKFQDRASSFKSVSSIIVLYYPEAKTTAEIFRVVHSESLISKLRTVEPVEPPITATSRALQRPLSTVLKVAVVEVQLYRHCGLSLYFVPDFRMKHHSSAMITGITYVRCGIPTRQSGAFILMECTKFRKGKDI